MSSGTSCPKERTWSAQTQWQWRTNKPLNGAEHLPNVSSEILENSNQEKSLRCLLKPCPKQRTWNAQKQWQWRTNKPLNGADKLPNVNVSFEILGNYLENVPIAMKCPWRVFWIPRILAKYVPDMSFNWHLPSLDWQQDRMYIPVATAADVSAAAAVAAAAAAAAAAEASRDTTRNAQTPPNCCCCCCCRCCCCTNTNLQSFTRSPLRRPRSTDICTYVCIYIHMYLCI